MCEVSTGFWCYRVLCHSGGILTYPDIFKIVSIL